MFSVGAGSKVKVNVPSPLSNPTGPPEGSHPHHGPDRRYIVVPHGTATVKLRAPSPLSVAVVGKRSNDPPPEW